jgi:hypothetical protein
VRQRPVLSALVCVSERVGVPLEQPARGHVDERVAARVHVSLHGGVALGDFNLEQVAKVLEHLTDQRDVCCVSQHHQREGRKVSTWDEHSSGQCVSKRHQREGRKVSTWDEHSSEGDPAFCDAT